MDSDATGSFNVVYGKFLMIFEFGQEGGKNMEQKMEVAQGFYMGRLEVGGLTST